MKSKGFTLRHHLLGRTPLRHAAKPARKMCIKELDKQRTVHFVQLSASHHSTCTTMQSIPLHPSAKSYKKVSLCHTIGAEAICTGSVASDTRTHVSFALTGHSVHCGLSGH
jgi:hypothetical protein